MFSGRSLRSIACTAFVAALFAACVDARGEDQPVLLAATGDDGFEVRLASPPARVITLIPAVTELVLALGAGDRLAARTDYDFDPAIAHLPSVGQGLTPNIEWLTARTPELVVAWPDGQARSVAGRLREIGIPVYGARIESIADVLSTTRRVATLLGLQPQGDSLAGEIERQLDSVRRDVAGRTRLRVLYVVWYDPPMTAGPGTFVNDLIEVAGGRSIFAEGPAGWPQVALEEILRRDPDVLIVPVGPGQATLHHVLGAPGWRDLRAVRQGRVHAVDAEIFNRPGPRIGEVARDLAALLHGIPGASGGAVAPGAAAPPSPVSP